MASFNGKIDLLSFKDAKLVSFEDKGKPRNFVCIPLDYNNIDVQENSYTHKQQALLSVNVWPYGDAYANTAREKARQRGDDPNSVSVPSHKMEVSFSTDYVKCWAKILAPSVIEQNKERHPEWATQNPEDENTALFKAIRSRMNFRIANLYLNQSHTPTTTAYQAPVAQGVSGYTQPVSDAPFDFPADDSDLLF